MAESNARLAMRKQPSETAGTVISLAVATDIGGYLLYLPFIHDRLSANEMRQQALACCQADMTTVTDGLVEARAQFVVAAPVSFWPASHRHT